MKGGADMATQKELENVIKIFFSKKENSMLLDTADKQTKDSFIQGLVNVYEHGKQVGKADE